MEDMMTTELKSWDEPTQAEVDSVCMSYRHDFGLLSDMEKHMCRFQAVEWLHAWRKELNR